MEGQGPSRGPLLKMDLVNAGTNPLATDIVSASIMGFEPNEVPTFTWANKAGMKPTKLDEIEIRGEKGMPLGGNLHGRRISLGLLLVVGGVLRRYSEKVQISGCNLLAFRRLDG